MCEAIFAKLYSISGKQDHNIQKMSHFKDGMGGKIILAYSRRGYVHQSIIRGHLQAGYILAILKISNNQ